MTTADRGRRRRWGPLRGWGAPSGNPSRTPGFTLIELLVVVSVIGVLAALLLPGIGKAKGTARRIACLSNLRQQAIAWQSYLHDSAERFPDRRELKTAPPGGFKPWDTWPKSDPRAGWAGAHLQSMLPEEPVWHCPALRGSPLLAFPQANQHTGESTHTPTVQYWMWRFDRLDEPVSLDNFWGKTVDSALADLRQAGNPNAPAPSGPGDVELIVDIYFPRTAPDVPPELKGRAAHAQGRNRACLDGRAEFVRDPRLR